MMFFTISNYLYQPLSQFEATLYSTSFVNFSVIGLVYLIIDLITNLFNAQTYVTLFYYTSFLWVFEFKFLDVPTLLSYIGEHSGFHSAELIFKLVLVEFCLTMIWLVGSDYEDVEIYNSIADSCKKELYEQGYLGNLFYLAIGSTVAVVLFLKYFYMCIVGHFIYLIGYFTNFFPLYMQVSGISDEDLVFIDTSITKFHIITFFILLYFLIFFVLCFKNSRYYFRNWNIILFGMIDEFLSNTIVQQLGVSRGQKYSVLLKSIFFLILLGNLLGLIPFSFTITSHLIYTFSISLSLLLGITILGLYLQGFKFFNLFVPGGAPKPLLVLLVPIEIISYVARCFSLAIRLFANMMSGHTLLNILSGFVIKMAGNGLLLIALAPFAVVMAVSVLELGIAFLQAYVFVVLLCIYLKDGFDASH